MQLGVQECHGSAAVPVDAQMHWVVSATQQPAPQLMMPAAERISALLLLKHLQHQKWPPPLQRFVHAPHSRCSHEARLAADDAGGGQAAAADVQPLLSHGARVTAAGLASPPASAWTAAW